MARSKFRRLRNWYILRRRGNNFLGSQWAGGVVLVIFVAVALVLANLEATKYAYHHILEMDMGFSIGNFSCTLTIEQWINDALMAIFFFVVGLEIKREIVAGELSNVKHAALPVAAALGGMVVPALIYFALNHGTEYEAGWGIPMGTDIAFAIGILSLLGNRIPISLKIFLTALAIVDDLGAILIIAIFYTSHIDFIMLGSAFVLLLILFEMNRRGVSNIVLYAIPGLVIWYLFLNSGVHATISGVLVALTMPTRPRFSRKYFTYKVRYFLEEFRFYDKADKEVISNPDQFHALEKVSFITRGTSSTAQRWEHTLNPYVSLLIMPVFALANAGVEISSFDSLRVLAQTQGLGIYLGLVVGKPLGIFLFCWLTIKLGLAALPESGTWGALLGVACLGGIGFTMSIFIDNLAFASTEFIDTGKIAVLFASVSSAVIGAFVINMISKKSVKTN